MVMGFHYIYNLYIISGHYVLQRTGQCKHFAVYKWLPAGRFYWFVHQFKEMTAAWYHKTQIFLYISDFGCHCIFVAEAEQVHPSWTVDDFVLCRVG